MDSGNYPISSPIEITIEISISGNTSDVHLVCDPRLEDYAIQTTSSISLQSIILQNCSFGAIQCAGAINTIWNCSFESNSSPTNGGALSFTGNASSTIISNSTFLWNSAYAGGAIFYQSDQSNAQIHIDHCKFEHNQATNYGGAIYATAPATSNHSLQIHYTQFHENIAATGGALQTNISTISVTQTEFIKNLAQPSESGMAGGALLVSSSNFFSLVVDWCLFVENSVISKFPSVEYAAGAGGIGVDGSKLGDVLVANSEFFNHTIQGTFIVPGAVILVYSESFHLLNCTIGYNLLTNLNVFTTIKGAFVGAECAQTIIIESSQMINNYVTPRISSQAQAPLGIYGIAGFLASPVVEILSSKFENTTTSLIASTHKGTINIDGIAVEVHHSHNITILDSQFIGNSVTCIEYQGTQLTISGSLAVGSPALEQLLVSNCNFTDNLITESLAVSSFWMLSGAGMQIESQGENSLIQFLQCKFLRNSLIAIGDAGPLHGWNSMFGGGLYLQIFMGTIYMNQTFFGDNYLFYNGFSALVEGAGAFIQNSKSFPSPMYSEECVYRNNSIVIENTFCTPSFLATDGYGSGAGLCSGMAHHHMSNSLFELNSISLACSSGFGYLKSGGFSTNFAEVIIFNNVTFFENSLHGPVPLGGAFTIDASMYITDCLIQNNYAVVDVRNQDVSVISCGGGVYWGSNNYIALNSVRFLNNSAMYGGGICLKFYSPGTEGFRELEFTNNSATVGGGLFVNAEIWNDTALTGSDFGEFSGNTAVIYGADYASKPWKLITDNPPLMIVTPGQYVRIQLMLIDYFGNYVGESNYRLLINYDQDPEFVSGVPNNAMDLHPSDNPVYSIDSAYLLGSPKTHNIVFQITNIRGTFQKNVTLLFDVTQCLPGYFYDVNLKQCFHCDDFQYSWSGATTCTDCPVENSNCISSPPRNYTEISEVSLGPGVWPEPSFENPSWLIACANPEACLEIICLAVASPSTGQWELDCSRAQSYCATGYSERECSKCVCESVDECWYASQFVCYPCNSSVMVPLYLSVFAFVGLTALFFVFPKGALIGALGEICLSLLLVFVGFQSWVGFFLSSWVLLFVALLNNSTSGSALKSFITFGQLSQLIFRPALWASWIPVGILTSEGIFRLPGIECVFPGYADRPAIKYVSSMLLPIILMFIVIILALAIYFTKRLWVRFRKPVPQSTDDAPDWHLLTNINNSASDETDELLPVNLETQVRNKGLFVATLKGILFISFSCYISLSGGVLAVLQPCDDGYMTEIPWISCSWSNWTYVSLVCAGIVFMAVYVIGIPLVYAILLFINKRFPDHWISDPISFLCEEYRPQMYYYELVWMVRRILVIGCVSLIKDTSPWQVGCTSFVLAASIIVQAICQPFQSYLDNFVETLASVSLLGFYLLSWLLQSSLFPTLEPFQNAATVVYLIVLTFMFFVIFTPLVRAALAKLKFLKTE
jgi:predicted outer membrane repeat protein